jgi:hypothetical protein
MFEMARVLLKIWAGEWQTGIGPEAPVKPVAFDQIGPNRT